MYEAKITVFVAKKGHRPRGVGKTLLMTDVGYRDYKTNNKKTIANYHLNWPHIFMPFDKIIEFPEELYDANVLVDEIFVGGNSRNFMSKNNIKLIEFLTQIRKRNCDVFITAQTARQLDVGIRDQVDIIVEMNKHKKEGEIVPLFFDVVVRDRHDWNEETNVLNSYIYDAREFASLKMYDTNEIITFTGTKRKGDVEPIESEEENNEIEVNDNG